MISMSTPVNDDLDAPGWLRLLEAQQTILTVCENEYNTSNMTSKGLGNREKRVINKKILECRDVFPRLDRALQTFALNPIKYKIGEGEIQRRKGLLSSLRLSADKLEHNVNNVGRNRRAPLPVETAETAQISNQQLFANQREDISAQDAKLDGILDGVSRLKVMSQDINQELDLHANLLSELDDAVDATDARIQRNTKRIDVVSEQSGGWCGLLIMIVLFILIILLLATNWFCHVFNTSKC